MKQNLSIQNILLSEIDLAIKWSDETELFINLKLLRDSCPCAFCSGEKDVFGNIYKGPKKELNEIAYKVVKVEQVGHYAIRCFWGDRHADGLYTFEILKRLEVQ